MRAYLQLAKTHAYLNTQAPNAMRIILHANALRSAALSIAQRRGDELIDVRRTVSNETNGRTLEAFIPTL